jgi:hypothetical protein
MCLFTSVFDWFFSRVDILNGRIEGHASFNGVKENMIPKLSDADKRSLAFVGTATNPSQYIIVERAPCYHT